MVGQLVLIDLDQCALHGPTSTKPIIISEYRRHVTHHVTEHVATNTKY